MPIYEYQCTKCQHEMEALRKISDEPLVDCPACGKPGLVKLVSAASFRLKGGGWYETDFKTGNKKQLADSDSAAASADKSNKSGSDETGSGSKSGKSETDSASKGSANKSGDATKKASTKTSAS